MKGCKKLLCLVLAVIMLVSLCPFAFANGLDNFQKIQTYRPGQYTDIAEGVWWTENIAAAYELGLMKGNANGSFAPRGSISIIETIVIASRLHAIYYGTGEIFVQGKPWYQVYLDYAENNGIITPGRFSELSELKAPASRSEFAEMLSKSMEADALPAINDIPDLSIPDLPLDLYCADAVYLLYRAGILTGSDTAGNFKPDSNITRAEAAAVLTRMADPTLRKSLTLRAPVSDGTLVYTPNADNTGYIVTSCTISSVESLTIPAECDGLPVKEIKGGIFADCLQLKSINVDEANEYLYSEDGVVFTDSPVKTLVCFPPAYSTNNYYYVPSDVKAIGPYAFAGLGGLTSLTIPEGVTTMGDYAFTKVRTEVFVFVPNSLTNIGKFILQGQLSNMPFYVPSWDCAMAKYCDANNITCGAIGDTTPKTTTVTTSVPKHQTSNLVPADESKLVYHYGYDAYEGFYAIGDLYQRYDLSEEEEAATDGEVRLVLDNSWKKITPENHQFKNVPAQSGLYGAGYTESAAILRAYDKDGTLIAMQNISGNFSFSFPDARSLGIEGGTNTGLTVIPIEPVFVKSPGSYAIDADKCYRTEDGNVFQYLIIQYPYASVYPDFPHHLNFLGTVYFDCSEMAYFDTSSRYTFVYCSSSDASRVDQMKAYALVFDGLKQLIDNDEFSCSVGKNFKYSADFGQKCYNLLKTLKSTMLGNYFPKNEPVNKITILGDGSYPSAFESQVTLDKYAIENFERVTIIHEMVHAIDQSIESTSIAPSPWMEGRAEYICYKVCDKLGVSYWHDHNNFDWSFLSAEDRADFFNYFYFNTDRQNPYPIGYIFIRYLCKTYGENVTGKIMANIAAVEYDGYNQDETTAAMFKKCVEDATEVGVFQNFVRDVIGG